MIVVAPRVVMTSARRALSGRGISPEEQALTPVTPEPIGLRQANIQQTIVGCWHVLVTSTRRAPSGRGISRVEQARALDALAKMVLTVVTYLVLQLIVRACAPIVSRPGRAKSRGCSPEQTLTLLAPSPIRFSHLSVLPFEAVFEVILL